MHGYEFEAPQEEALAFRRFQRRIRYQEVDVKQERFDQERAVLLPSKEDSLERLYELGVDFAGDQEPVEDAVVTKVMVDKLHKCINRLAEDERNLIFALFFQGKSEAEYGDILSITQQAVSNKQQKVLIKLGKMLNLYIS